MQIDSLVIAGIRIYMQSRFQINQTYNDIGGTSSFRTLSGKLIKQTHWEGFSTSISVTGLLPAPIRNIDKTVPLTLDCIAPMSELTSGSLLFTIPRVIRPDVDIEVSAIVGDDIFEAEFSIVGNDVTITAIADADDYIITYYPRMTVFILDVQDTSDINERVFSWSIECEEELA